MNGKKTRNFILRLTPEEYGQLRRNAATRGCSMAEHIRRTAIHGEQVAPVNIDMEPIRKLLFEYQKQGANINQLAHMVNIYGLTNFDSERLDQMIDRDDMMQDKFRKLLRDLKEGKLSL